MIPTLMIPTLQRRLVPQWLAALRSLDHLPLQDVLSGSLYYPASGTDGGPVKYLGGHVHSFVYADYGIAEEDQQKAMAPGEGFVGYRILMQRKVGFDELYPKHCKPVQLRPEDGDPRLHQDWIKPPFAIWTILEREPGLKDDHGPHRFSFLFICDEAVTVFHNLYRANRRSPECLAIIQPGTGFGCNWTDFRDASKILAREVVGNPAGKPRYLLYGGLTAGYDTSPWPREFNSIIAKWSNRNNERYNDENSGRNYNFVLWETGKGGNSLAGVDCPQQG